MSRFPADHSGPAGFHSRRTFVKSAVGAAGLWVLSDPLLSRALAAVPGATDATFTQGVACGQVDQTSATLWTALSGIDAPTRLTVEVATDAGFGSVIARAEALADPAMADTARLRVGGGALRPGEQYWYRFETADGVSSPVGRLRTSLPPDSMDPVRIAFFACQDFLSGNYAAHRDMAAQDADLAVCLGDYIYEQAYFEGSVRTVPTTPDGSVRTYEEYREQYATYHSDEHLQAMRAAGPLAAIWDDHEVEDNYAGTLPGGASHGKGARPIPFLERRANAYRAFFEAMPVITDPATPNRVYGSRRIGQVDLTSLDTRQFRTNQPCNPSDSFIGACSPAGLAQTRSKAATQLGTAQREWLFEHLRTTDAPWKLIANQVMAMSLDLVPGYPLNTDSWDGYAYERSLLCDAITQHGIEDVALFTGDIHTFFAGSLTRTGRASGIWVDGLKKGPPVAAELVVGSITSQGIADRFATKEPDKNAAARILDPIIRNSNPHLRYSNSAYKGYGIADVTATEMRVEYRAVRDPRDANSAVFSLAKFVVPRGQPYANQVAAGPAATPARGLTLSHDRATAAIEAFTSSH